MTDEGTELSEAQEEFVTRFADGYAHAMLWANTEEIADGEPTGESVDPAGWATGSETDSLDAFAPASRGSILSDCRDFVAGNWADVSQLDAVSAGGDFALTRNGHGAGFWDRGYGDLGDRLTAASEPYGDSGAWYDTADPALVHLQDEPAPEADREAGE